MEITLEELNKLDKDEYVLLDMRSQSDRAYGAIPGSIAADAEALIENPPAKGKKAVVYCARGVFSVDVALALREKGVDAYSLVGGYSEWLRAEMKKKVDDDYCENVEKSIRTKFRLPLMSRFIKAIKQYELIKEGDRIAVCISGGKDSMLMAKLFQELHRYTEFDFGLEFVVMDPGYNAENRRIIEENAKRLKVPVRIFESDIFESVYNVEKSPCYLCARMRRGYLYNFARQLGCNKIALGHHYDDVIETILMGMLYGAQIQTMMPKLHSANFEGMELIRPMYLIREDDIKAWRDYNG
ncbi:MAG: ATP-binding protein, partial [Candidatus Neoclostridium sp.]